MSKAYLVALGLLLAAVQLRADLCGFVDPFVGTTATGHTSPAAAYPFGMVQAGPTTGTISWQYCSGYRYEDTAVTGYALTALSGTGFCEYNELQVLPFSGDVRKLPMTSAIDKTTEKAEPGCYAVHQSQDGVKVEIAAAKHAAIYLFRWDKGGQTKVLVNLPYGNGQRDGNQLAGSHDGKVTKFGDCRIEGEHFRTGCIMRRRIAFALEFSRPWTACEELPKGKPDELPRYVLSFDLRDGEALLLKSAFSITSPEAARRNLLSSIPAWDFDGVRSATRAAWNELLSRSVCEGTDEQKKNWYTALYHLYFQPNDYSDAGDEKPYYTTLSLWDTFRACHPWYSIVTPEVNAGAVDSFMRHYRTFGRLPVMSYGGMNFDCMIGNHSIPVIVDAFLKEVQVGSRSSTNDVENSIVGLPPTTTTKHWDSIYAAIKNTLTQAHPGKPKENWDIYDKYGYFPYDRINGESVSRTFECAYDDWCAAQMAKGLGKAEDYKFFMKRAGYWKNVFDSSIGFARGKSADGKWREPFDPFAFGHGAGRDNDFTEGNAFQYSWHVMHDVDGLVAAMGGREAALKKLEALFTADATAAGAPPDVTGLIGQYVHGNEPSHHVIYLYSLLGRPDLTAKYVREVFDRFYLPKPDGLCGNDDCGQMSAWYLFSAMGFYPFNPCGGEYVIGAPQLSKVVLEVGKRTPVRFVMTAKNLSKENKYVKSVTLNGKTITDWKIFHADIVKGGTLEFEMCGVEPSELVKKIGFDNVNGDGHSSGCGKVRAMAVNLKDGECK